MKIYKIPVIWQSWGLLQIEAESLEEAIEIAESPEQGLPYESDYIEDSFEVDRDGIEIYNED